MVRINLDVGGLPLHTAKWLVNHDFAVRKSKALTFLACGKQEGTHAGSHAYAYGRNIAFDVVHGVKNGHTGTDGSTGAVDVEMNILFGIHGFQIQHLCDNKRSGCVIHLVGKKNDAVIQQSGKNVERTFAAVGFLNDHRDESHMCTSFRETVTERPQPCLSQDP